MDLVNKLDIYHGLILFIELNCIFMVLNNRKELIMNNKRLLMAAIAATALSLGSQTAFATTIDFVSGTDDGCKVGAVNCTLSTNAYSTWITEANFNTAAGSTGAQWVQQEGSYIDPVLNDYRVFEMDLNMTGEDMWITSLWVSADDTFKIKSAGVELFDSITEFAGNEWNTAIDVHAITGDIFIAAASRLNFYVHDISSDNRYPTGLIYAGTAVPEPAIIALLGLGLVGFGFSRRKSNSAKS
ncbi:MAG: hypothetical protein ACJAT7_000188 [Psychromonas sp.]|jgi:hypothetical protein